MKSAVLPGMFATGLETGPREQDDETRRQLSSKDRILARLQKGSALNSDLNGICYRYGARLMDLRDEGHVIETESLKAGKFRYRLVSSPKEND